MYTKQKKTKGTGSRVLIDRIEKDSDPILLNINPISIFHDQLPTLICRFEFCSKSFCLEYNHEHNQCILTNLFMVLGFYEWHLGNNSILDLVANLDAQISALLVESALDVAHGNVLFQARRRAARGYLADNISLLIQDLCALASRCALYNQANAASLNCLFILDLCQDTFGAQESSGLTARLGDGPRQTCLNRSRGIIQVVSVQAQSGLETQTVASAETGHFDVWVSQKLLCNAENFRSRD